MLQNGKSYEEDNRTGVNHEGDKANTPLKRLTATSIIGDKIENPKGEKLGSIEDLMIDLTSGEIEYAVVEFGGVLGVGEKLFAVPFSKLQLKEGEEKFLLDQDLDFLKKSPGFDKSHWPDTNGHDEYLENVSSYYQVATPGFEI
jgi:sporulation protein YlmC with PRC-barrel domain